MAKTQETVQTRGRLIYIDPNELPSEGILFNGDKTGKNITWDMEDLQYSVDLLVSVPDLKKPTSFNQTINNITINSNNMISFFGGKKLDNSNETYLTDDYINASYTEINNGKYSSRENLGISSIDINFNAQFFPQVTITFQDVRAYSLMAPAEEEYVNNLSAKAGQDSKTYTNMFKALFHFPYPNFFLRIKGYYGSRVTFILAVNDFKSSFNSATGNFEVKVNFIGYMYGLYTDIPMNLLLVAPYYGVEGGETNEYWNQQVENGIFCTEEDVALPTLMEFRKKYAEIEENIKIEIDNDNIGVYIKEYSKNKQDLKKIEEIIEAYNYLIPTNETKTDDSQGMRSFEDGNDTYILWYNPDKKNTFEFNDTLYTTLENCINGCDIEDIKNKWSDGLTFENVNIDTNINDKIKFLYGLNEDDVTDKYSCVKISNSFIKYVKQKYDTLKNTSIDEDKVNKVQSEMNDLVSEALGIKLTITNVYRMIFAHLDTFMHYLYTDCIDLITKKTPNEGRVISNFKEDIDIKQPSKSTDLNINTKSVDELPPFTGFYKKNGELSYEREMYYPGDATGRNLQEIEEVKFIEKLERGIIDVKDTESEIKEIIANKNDEEDESNETFSEGFKPLSFMDFLYGGENVYDRIWTNSNSNEDKIRELYNFLSERIENYERFSLPPYSRKDGNDYKSNIEKEIAKREFENFKLVHENELIKEIKNANDVFDVKKIDEKVIYKRISDDLPFSEGDIFIEYKVDGDFIETSKLIDNFKENGANKFFERINSDYYAWKEESETDVYNLLESSIENQSRKIEKKYVGHLYHINKENNKYEYDKDDKLSDGIENYYMFVQNLRKRYGQNGIDNFSEFAFPLLQMEFEKGKQINYLECPKSTFTGTYIEGKEIPIEIKQQWGKLGTMLVFYACLSDGNRMEYNRDDVIYERESHIFSMPYFNERFSCLSALRKKLYDEYGVDFFNAPQNSRNEYRNPSYYLTSNKDFISFDEKPNEINKANNIYIWYGISISELIRLLLKTFQKDWQLYVTLQQDASGSTKTGDFKDIITYNKLSQGNEIALIKHYLKCVYLVCYHKNPNKEKIIMKINKYDIFTEFQKLLNDYFKSNANLVDKREANKVISENDADKLEKERTKNHRLAMYYLLKNLYNKWLPSYNASDFALDEVKTYKERIKTRYTSDSNKVDKRNEFDNFLFIDCYNNDIGNIFYINPATLFNLIEKAYDNGSVYEFMAELAEKNKLSFMSLPIYTNYYNKDSIKSIFTPNTLYGINDKEPYGIGNTYICMYTHEASHILDDSTNDGSLLGDDGIDLADSLGRLKEEANAFIANNNEDGRLNITIPCFNIAYGKQNQSYFKNINVNMDNPVVTDYSIANLLQIANNGDNGAINSLIGTGQDLYSIYSNRSYSCSVEMMGCMNIMPLMYFQLNQIPMFRGAYMITNVEHHIAPGEFTTTFKGTRLNKNQLPYNSNVFDLDELINIINESEVSNGSKKKKGYKKDKRSANRAVIVDYGRFVDKAFNTDRAVSRMYEGINLIDGVEGMETALKTCKDKELNCRNIVPIFNTKSIGACAFATSFYIAAGFGAEKNQRFQIGNANETTPYLEKLGFKCLYKGLTWNVEGTGVLDYGKIHFDDGFYTTAEGRRNKSKEVATISLQKGDIMVMDYMGYGHICMYSGKEWVSDFKQENGFYPTSQKGPKDVRLYRWIPKNETYGTYRS